MMQKYFFGLCLMFGFSAQAQVVNIPDVNFKNALVTSLCADLDNNNTYESDVDTNDDGEIQVSEAMAVIRLNVTNKNISDLTGIESFQNMMRLICDNNQISTLHLTNLFNLYGLYCSLNNMTSLTITNCFNLNQLTCSGNLMTEIDLSGTRISRVYIDNNPNLTTLNLKNGVFMDSSYNSRNTSPGVGIPPPPPSRIESNPNLVYICADEDEIDYINANVISSFNNPNLFISSYCTEQPGGSFNTVSGVVHYDCNGVNFPAAGIKITYSNGSTSGYIFTSSNGSYHFYAPIGLLTITTQTEENAYFTASPASHVLNFETVNNLVTADFCLSNSANSHNDLGITMYNYGPARPGFDAQYKLIYTNRGNQTQSGTVTFAFDDATTDFVSATPAITAQSANVLTWNFTGLAPLETREIMVTLNLNGPMETPPLNLGDMLTYTSVINAVDPDENMVNNQKTFHQFMVGSLDPNDKAVVEGAQISTAQTSDYLHYMVRFQNTGTYAAEKVVVKDMLSANLDWSTLEMVSSSHPYRSTLTNGNQLEVFYDNINLPPASENEPGSNGYIAFKIKPKGSIAVDDVILNTANIYFDFNFPIVTNTVSTTVTALGTDDFETPTFSIYPNPTNGILNLVLAPETIVKTGSIYTMLGQKVVTFDTVATDVSFLPQGHYIIILETDKGKTAKPFVKL